MPLSSITSLVMNIPQYATDVPLQPEFLIPLDVYANVMHYTKGLPLTNKEWGGVVILVLGCIVPNILRFFVTILAAASVFLMSPWWHSQISDIKFYGKHDYAFYISQLHMEIWWVKIGYALIALFLTWPFLSTLYQAGKRGYTDTKAINEAKARQANGGNTP